VNDFYQGILRVMDPNGFLLDIGSADLRVVESSRRTWNGLITVAKVSCIDRKSLTALVETADGQRSLAQISPSDSFERGRFITMDVAGLAEPPF
jgi:hypothetical protein